MPGPPRPSQLTPQPRRWVISLIGAGLLAGAIMVSLPSRSQAIAMFGVSTLALLFGSIRSGAATVLNYQAHRWSLTTVLPAVLTTVLLLSAGATLNDLRMFLRRSP